MSLAKLLQKTAAGAIVDDDDTGGNTPESPATLAAQSRAVRAGRQRAVMYPRGTDEAPLPRGLARVETARGVFHYDPSQIDAEDIQRASLARRENDVLGLGPASKADVLARAAQGEPVAGVVERQPDGVEVKSAVVTPSTAPGALREITARAAPGNRVAVEPVEGVIASRPRRLAALRAAVGGADAPPAERPRGLAALLAATSGREQQPARADSPELQAARRVIEDLQRDGQLTEDARLLPAREAIERQALDAALVADAKRIAAPALLRQPEAVPFIGRAPSGRSAVTGQNADEAQARGEAGLRHLQAIPPALADDAKRLARSTGASGWDAVAGMADSPRAFFGVLAEALGRYAVATGDLTPEQAAQAAEDMRQAVDEHLVGIASRGAAENARETAAFTRAAYDIDLSRDDALTAKLAEGAGSLPIAISTGPAAPVVVAGMMSEQGRRDAAETLAARGVTDPAELRRAEDIAAALNAPVGLVSELMLGAPAMLRSVGGMGGVTSILERLSPTARTAAGRLLRQLGLGAVREGVQEGGEQFAQNVIARDLAGYDPERDRGEGVLEAAGVGALIGGPVSLGFQGAQELDARANPQAEARPPVAVPREQSPVADLVDEKGKPEGVRQPATPDDMTGQAGTGQPQSVPASVPTVKRSPNADPAAEILADAITARPVEDFRADVADGLTGPDIDLVAQLERYGAASRPPGVESETLDAFTERMTARLGERVRPYVPAAFDAMRGEAPPLSLVATSQPLALEPTWRRAITYGRLFWEGSADVLQRAGLRSLAQSVRNHVDFADRNFAKAWAPIKDALAPFSGVKGLARRGQMRAAFETFEAYFEARESGDVREAAELLDTATPEARRLIEATLRMFEVTGAENRRIGVRVLDAEGKARSIGELGARFFPRVLREDVAAVLRDPTSNPELWRQMQADLIADGRIKDPAEAVAYTANAAPPDVDHMSRSDYFAGLETARGARLPAAWYEHRFEKIVPRYAAAWAERAAQIEAFGQKLTGEERDAFDVATLTANDANLAAYIKKTREAAYRFNRLPQGLRTALGNVTSATTGLLLGNPYSTARNLIGGLAQTTNQFGPVRAVRSLREAFRAASSEQAEATGALKADIADLLFHSDGSPVVKHAASLALRVNGFNAVEQFVRTHNLLTARAFLRDALAAMRDRPRSKRALQAVAFLRRHQIDPDKVAAEAGAGPETERFLRGAVRQAQGGYRYDQVPLFTNSPLGRFLFQFARWGTMATRFHVKHALAPALVGEVVPVRNADGTTTKRRVRTLTPLLRSPLVAMAAGATTYAVRDALFGIARTDQTWDEIFAALDDDEQRGVELALGRMVNDIVMGGTFGMVSDYANDLRWALIKGEARSPVEPPALGLAKEVWALGEKAHAQRGRLSAQDLREFAGRLVTGYKYSSALAQTFAERFDIRWDAARRHAAEQDRRFARGVGRRFAEAQGYPPPEPPPEGVPLVSRNTPVYDALEDALHAGDIEAAQRVLDDAMQGARTDWLRAKIRGRFRAAVLNRMPMRPGGRNGYDDREDFRDWMHDNLSQADRRRVEDAQARFIANAVRAGLLNEADLENYADGADPEDYAE